MNMPDDQIVLHKLDAVYASVPVPPEFIFTVGPDNVSKNGKY